MGISPVNEASFAMLDPAATPQLYCLLEPGTVQQVSADAQNDAVAGDD